MIISSEVFSSEKRLLESKLASPKKPA